MFLCLQYTSAWSGKHLCPKDLHIVCIFVYDRSLETRKQLWKAVLQKARAQHLKWFLYLLSAYLSPPALLHQVPQAHQNLHYPLLCLHQPKQACQIQSKPVLGRVTYQFLICIHWLLILWFMAKKRSYYRCRYVVSDCSNKGCNKPISRIFLFLPVKKSPCTFWIQF